MVEMTQSQHAVPMLIVQERNLTPTAFYINGNVYAVEPPLRYSLFSYQQHLAPTHGHSETQWQHSRPLQSVLWFPFKVSFNVSRYSALTYLSWLVMVGWTPGLYNRWMLKACPWTPRKRIWCSYYYDRGSRKHIIKLGCENTWAVTCMTYHRQCCKDRQAQMKVRRFIKSIATLWEIAQQDEKKENVNRCPPSHQECYSKLIS